MESLVYTIIGILATVIVGYFGIRISKRYNKQTKISFYENKVTLLFDSLVNNLEGLEIIYKGGIVTKNLILYKLTIANSGNIDIDKNIVHEPLKTELPPNYFWRKLEVIKKSDDLNLEHEINEKSASFSWDIFKEKEFFTFESIIEYIPDENLPSDDSKKTIVNIKDYLSKNIEFKQRITNIKSIDEIKLKHKPTYHDLFGSIIYPIIILVISLKAIIFYPFLTHDKLYFEIDTKPNKTYVNIESIKKRNLTLIDTLGRKVDKININQIPENFFTGKVISASYEKFTLWDYLGFSLFIIGSIVWILFRVNIYINKVRKFRLLKASLNRDDLLYYP